MKINDEILKEVAKKSMRNAESLMSDADILRESKRYQRAYTLYQFAMEEVGKAISSVFLLALVDPTEEEIKKYETDFYKHPPKIKRSGALDMLICQFLHKGDYDGAMKFIESCRSENEKFLDEQKNKSLYTAIIDDSVLMPSEMVGEKNMNYIWFRALTRYKMALPFVKITLENYSKIREYQQENGSIRHMSLDVETAAKDFWDEILKDDQRTDP